MFKNRYLLMNPEDDNGSNSGGGGGAGGGTGGAGSGADDSASGGGGGLLSKQGSGGAGNGADQGGKASGDNGGANQPEVKYPENWKLGLPKELQESGALSVIHDIPALAKSFINAQKLIGADKIPLPSKHAGPDEWREVYHKLGVPKDVKDYKIELGKDSGLSETFVPQLAAKAHELGILPSQAKALAEWMGAENKTALASQSKSQASALTEEVGKLKAEWGAAFPLKLSEAQAALSHFASPEEIAHIEKSGLVNDIVLVKIFNKVASVLKEDGIIKEGANVEGQMTPAAAQEAIDLILRDGNHPYYNKEHAGHKMAVAEVTRLFSMKNPKKQK